MKLYFKRGRYGEAVKYHEAPGMDEAHLVDGLKPKDIEHLIPNEQSDMPQQIVNSSVLQSLYDSTAFKSLKYIIAIGWAVWWTAQWYQSDTQYKAMIAQHEAYIDTTVRPIVQALGSPREINDSRSMANIAYRVVSKHHPKDVQQFVNEMQWNGARFIIPVQ